MLDAAFAEADIIDIALRGLTATPKTLPPKLFYDAAGVQLFEAITRLPEYYLTRAEMALLRRIAPEVAALADPQSALVEYGASDEAKAAILLDEGSKRFTAYVPLDVALEALQVMEKRLRAERSWLHVYPVCADFLSPVTLPRPVLRRPKFGFFPGSTIGNLEPQMARAFLAEARTTLGAGAWLIVGADLRKDHRILVPAYDDAAGVTAAFNLNILRRLNREAGADFDLSSFAHRARWNDPESRIEMHLESLKDQTVHVGGEPVAFRQGETIHTENSYKHSIKGFQALARSAGWAPSHVWQDDAQLFSIHALRAS